MSLCSGSGCALRALMMVSSAFGRRSLARAMEVVVLAIIASRVRCMEVFIVVVDELEKMVS